MIIAHVQHFVLPSDCVTVTGKKLFKILVLFAILLSALLSWIRESGCRESVMILSALLQQHCL